MCVIHVRARVPNNNKIFNNNNNNNDNTKNIKYKQYDIKYKI